MRSEKTNDNGTKKASRRKWYYSFFSVLAAIIVFCTVYSLILPAITLTNDEDENRGHCALSYTMYSNTTKTRRAYLEYTLPGAGRSLTFGILRQSVIYVYAYAGETICLGSDITHSLIGADEKCKTSETGVDIVMIGPDGTKYTFDNDEETGIGYIGTAAQEKNGANFTGSNNENGYTPHEFLVRNTGLYEIRFHSYSGNYAKCSAEGLPHLRQAVNQNQYGVVAGSSGEPVYMSLSSNEWCNSGCTVGAFDVTVVNGNKEVETGRAYADYLAINMGNNSKSNPTLYGDFYMVTTDGYIYRSKFELDPFGFVFFGNNRGVVDTETGYSAYHSIKGKGQDSNAQIDTTGMNYTVYTPQNEGTALDSSTMIFFEEPDSKLEGVLFQRAFAPDVVDNIEFIGSKEGNITYVGNGGYFKFDIENSSSVTISISFEDYNDEHGTTYKNVNINANVTEGTNYVYWDGKDDNGDLVPEGWYKEGKIKIKVLSHSGEFHFPFLDVENANGVSFERTNNIYDYVDNQLVDVTENYEESRYMIYYNNTSIPDESIELEGAGKNNPLGMPIADGVDNSNGVDSQNIVMYYRNQDGDYTILDVWTYTTAEINTTITTDIIIEDLEGYYTVNLNGLVFFDKDESTRYDIAGGDFPLEDVEVSLDYYYCGTRWINIEKDGEGNVTRMTPAAHTSSTTDGQNNTIEVIDYYYHNYEVVYEDGAYYLYQYDYTDYYHENPPTKAKDKYGNYIIVDIEHDPPQEGEPDSDSYRVWIPVHRETTTSNLGTYFFSGVLVNENFYDPPEGKDNIVITVKNPNPELYEVTTENTITGDFNTYGTEVQEIPLSQLYSKVQEDLLTNPDRTNFFYSVADVGYYYDTYEPPITVAKRWGTLQDSDDVQKITFLLQGYAVVGGVTHVKYEREVVVDYYNWQKRLTDLPASAEIGGEVYQLEYRVYSELYKKSDGNYYLYTYHWDDENPSGTYEKVLSFDEDGKPDEKQLLTEDVYPYATYISPIQKINTGDYIYVENWTKSTTQITITKYSSDDNVSRLANATFKLQKLNPESMEYEDVITAQGVYTVTTDSNGIAVFRGLSAGEGENSGKYRLVETLAPANYQKAENIYFTVDENNEVNNGVVTGNYQDGYEVPIYDNLIESPVSAIYKYDQYGNPVQGATFEAYATDENYENRAATPAFTVTTNEDGKAVLYITKGNSTREMYISELKELLGGSNNFVLVETDVPDGYRPVGDAKMKIVGSGMASYIICENQYESGVWSKPSATVYAAETLQIYDMSQCNKVSNQSNIDSNGRITYTQFTDNGQITGKGTLFAVVLKRNGAEANKTTLRSLTGKDWCPVYGDDINGYHTVTEYSNTLDAVINTIQLQKNDEKIKFATPFVPSKDGTSMHAHLENFPGLATEYYTYYFDNPDLQVTAEEPQYLVAYYYTTANSIDGATARNTVQVRSHGYPEYGAAAFPIYWASSINVPDIVNSLYVQKRDTQGVLVDNAVFAMYDAVVGTDGKGYYVGMDSNSNKVYIRLGEDENLTAEIYHGTINSDGKLEITSGPVDAEYTVNTEKCSNVDDLDALEHDGYVDISEGDETGIISVRAGDNVYKIYPVQNAEEKIQVAYTHDECNYINEYGTGHFRYLNNGNYFLREIYAPGGFKLNYTNVEVVVDGVEVYANAGDHEDGVRVGNGAGYLVSTLNVFGSIGDISETLSYIKTALRLETDENGNAVYDGFTDISQAKQWDYVTLDDTSYETMTRYIYAVDGTEQTGELSDAAMLYLRYNGNANNETLERKTLFDYTYSPESSGDPDNAIRSLTLWTESGWSDLAIFQNTEYYLQQLQLHPNAHNNIKFTNLSEGENGEENDISRLFSSSTFVSFEDETEIELRLKKTDSSTENVLERASFLLYKYDDNFVKYYYTEDDDDNVVWSRQEEGQNVNEFAFTTGSDGIIPYKKLESGTYYLEEIVAPRGYNLLKSRIRITIAAGEVKAIFEDGLGTPLRCEKTDADNGVFTLVVPNNEGYVLPETGGNVNLFYTFGTLLTAAGAIMCGYRLRRKSERRVGD